MMFGKASSSLMSYVSGAKSDGDRREREKFVLAFLSRVLHPSYDEAIEYFNQSFSDFDTRISQLDRRMGSAVEALKVISGRTVDRGVDVPARIYEEVDNEMPGVQETLTG